MVRKHGHICLRCLRKMWVKACSYGSYVRPYTMIFVCLGSSLCVVKLDVSSCSVHFLRRVIVIQQFSPTNCADALGKWSRLYLVVSLLVRALLLNIADVLPTCEAQGPLVQLWLAEGSQKTLDLLYSGRLDPEPPQLLLWAVNMVFCPARTPRRSLRRRVRA